MKTKGGLSDWQKLKVNLISNVIRGESWGEHDDCYAIKYFERLAGMKVKK